MDTAGLNLTDTEKRLNPTVWVYSNKLTHQRADKCSIDQLYQEEKREEENLGEWGSYSMKNDW